MGWGILVNFIRQPMLNLKTHSVFFLNIFWILGLHVLTYDLAHNSKNKRMIVKSNITVSIVGHLYTSSISYMEPVHYDRQSLHHQHRTRRSTKEFIHLQFDAFSR